MQLQDDKILKTYTTTGMNENTTALDTNYTIGQRRGDTLTANSTVSLTPNNRDSIK